MCVEGGFFFFKINKRDSTFIRDMRVPILRVKAGMGLRVVDLKI